MTWLEADDPDCPEGTECTALEALIEPRAHDVGGFDVRRALPARAKRMIGPFVFFDQMGPATLAPETGLDVRPHPHIGLATVTWLSEGEIMHRDSLGHEQIIRPGELNWMSAGRGIVHSERTPQALRGAASRLAGVQAWVALPEQQQESEPFFVHYPATALPGFERDGARVVLIAGSAWGLRSPVTTYWETFYADLRLQAGAEFEVPIEVVERGVYLLQGGIEMDGVEFAAGRMLVLKPQAKAVLKAATACHLMLLGGAPLDGPRHIWWNFVSSSRERIEQAKSDWRAGRFPAVPGETESIPLPD